MRKIDVGFLVAGSILSIIFFMVVNFVVSPGYMWFIYPSFVLILWAVGLYCAKKRMYKLLSISHSMILIIFLIAQNIKDYPEHPWSLYAILPIIWWPILVCSGKKAGTMAMASIGSISIILYYILLNVFLSPGYPWAIYPAFVVLWWPLSLYHAKKKSYLTYSIQASLLTIIFFICVNFISSPNVIWAIYPAFVVLWWPISLYHAQRKTYLAYSIQASLLTIIFFVSVNLITSPGVIWAIYPIFAILWWPLSMYYFVFKRKVE